MRLTTAGANVTVAALADRLRDGWVQVLEEDLTLAECRLLGMVARGAEAHASRIGTSRAVAGGTPTRWRALDAERAPIMEGAVGTELVLPVIRIDAGDEVRLTSFRVRQEQVRA